MSLLKRPTKSRFGPTVSPSRNEQHPDYYVIISSGCEILAAACAFIWLRIKKKCFVYVENLRFSCSSKTQPQANMWWNVTGIKISCWIRWLINNSYKIRRANAATLYQFRLVWNGISKTVNTKILLQSSGLTKKPPINLIKLTFHKSLLYNMRAAWNDGHIKSWSVIRELSRN